MEETKSFAFPLKAFAQAFFVAIFALCALFAFTASAEAATTMYVSPATGSFAPGTSFTVGVYISTPSDKPANAISSTVSFPKDLLEVSSVSTGGSIVTLWVANPTYSNAAGTVHFEGVIVNPGYNGTAGKLVSITFKAKAAGSATVSFPSGSILANDGLGTNILSGFGSGKYTITGTETPAPTPTPPPTGVPAAPTITSSTHPDQNGWFSKNDVTFNWKMPSSVTGVNILADHNPNTDPGTTSDGIFSTYSYTDVDDGIWYAHLKLQNEKGWGPTAHYKFQIDTAVPQAFEIELIDGTDVTTAEPSIAFSTNDVGSGIDHYVVKVNGTEVARIAGKDVHSGYVYKLPAQTSGEKVVTVEAFDKAGNTVSAKAVTFTVTIVEEDVSATQDAEAEAQGFFAEGSLGFKLIAVLAGLLLLLALFFAIYVIWRSISSWGLFAIGKHRDELLHRLTSLRTYIMKHHADLERDIVVTGFTAAEKKTAKRVSAHLQQLQKSLNEEIDYLSE